MERALGLEDDWGGGSLVRGRWFGGGGVVVVAEKDNLDDDSDGEKRED